MREDCDFCCGRGYKEPRTKADAKNILRNWGGDFHNQKRCYREYLKDGGFTCPICEGTGWQASELEFSVFVVSPQTREAK